MGPPPRGAKRGPRTPVSDATVLAAIRAVLKASPFCTEGHRKVRARLRPRAPHNDGTELTLHYSYTLNLLGRLMKGYTDKQMRKGIGGMAKGLQRESERIATSRT